MARRRWITALAVLAAASGVSGPARATVAAGASGGRSKPVYSQSVVEIANVPMSDGAYLYVQILRPVTPARVKVPVILTESPYDFSAPDGTSGSTGDGRSAFDDIASFYVPRGYARAIADVRGTHNSTGCWDYGGTRERRDAYELVEWLAKRPWSSGKVGMIGGSYDGLTALQAAAEHAPHLAAIVPMSTPDRWYDYAYHNGVRWLANDQRPTDEGIDTPVSYDLGPDIITPEDYTGGTFAKALRDRSGECGRTQHQMKGYSTTPDYDSFWMDRDYQKGLSTSRVPALIAHGYLDYNVKASAAAAEWRLLKGPKRLVIGQWPHAVPSDIARGTWDELVWRWFDQWLLGLNTGVMREPPVQSQDNTGAWHQDASWPPRSVRPLYVTPAAAGGGGTSPGAAGEHATSISATIDDPLPVLFPAAGTIAWFDDPSVTENRMMLATGDLAFLRFQSGALTRDYRITGEPALNLRLSSDQTQTHVAVVVADVAPDGTWTLVSRGFFDPRYRAGLGKAKDIDTAKQYDIAFTLEPVDYLLRKGHAMSLVIGSSDAVWALPSPVRATNTMYLGSHSFLTLPLVP